jgi:tricorn protease
MAFQGYIRFPTLFEDLIVFVAEDDLWLISASGGRAERLTAGVAEATHPRFSPDGRHIAFTGRDEGPAEVYKMSLDAGKSERLTYLAAYTAVAGWTPDGQSIVFASDARQPHRGAQILYTVSPDGSEPYPEPFGMANAIAYGPGKALVLGRHIGDPARWKRYRGGTVGHLWIDATGKRRFKRLLDFNTNVGAPCWIGDRIYFISDHEGIGNVYSCLPSGADLQRHTNHEEYYARGLSTDGNRLVYHSGGDLYLLDLRAGESQAVQVELTGTHSQRARKFVSAAAYLDSWMPHPEGRHAVAVTARGKAYTLGAFDGPVLQHGSPDGTRYRMLAWLADGKRLVATHDDGGEPRLIVFSPDGTEPEVQLESLDIGTVAELRASPVGEKVVLLNHRCEVLLVDLAAQTMRVIDRSPYARTELASHVRGCAWSPDGRWIAYAFAINPRQTAIKLYNVENGESRQVTDPVLHDTRPAFDPGGKYLYFLSAREFDPVTDNLHFGWSFPRGVKPYLLTLQRDLRSPFGPESPDSTVEKAAISEQTPEPASDETEKGKPSPKPVEIDLDGIAARIVALPVPEGRYGRVQGTSQGIVFSSFPVEGARQQERGGLSPAADGALESYHFASHKQERLAEGISDFEVTSTGKTILYQAGERLRILKATEKVPQLEGDAQNKPGRESGWLDLERIRVSVRPELEWRQMLGEAWRHQREQFWTADMSGTDWQGMYSRYARLIERIGSRSELSDLFWELQGELGTSHSYEFGGEYRPRPQYQQGLLGVDWRFDAEAQRYTIAHIAHGDPWDPEATSPLRAPGANIQVGDTILAVNGQPVQESRSPAQYLVNQAGCEVELLVATPDGTQPRKVVVQALGSETPARYRDWVEENRRAVHQATEGEVGYLHIPDMSIDGFAEFHRSYLTEFDREALIVDVRWNRGGIVSNLLLETLMRPRLGYGFQRWGQPEPYFIESPRGPLVALTDENAGSDGDIFSHAFKMLKLGPLVGKRTWGGVIGYNDAVVPLSDGTITTQPEFSYWFTDVGWGLENYGADPTIEVEYPPDAYIAGVDPQLDRAISEALRLVAEKPSPTPTPGPRPSLAFPPRTQS